MLITRDPQAQRTAESNAAAFVQTRQRVGPQRAAKVQAVKVLRQSSLDLQDDMEDDSSSAWQGTGHQVCRSTLPLCTCAGSGLDSYTRFASLHSQHRIDRRLHASILMLDTLMRAAGPLETAAQQQRWPHAHRHVAQRQAADSRRGGGRHQRHQGRDHACECHEVSWQLMRWTHQCDAQRRCCASAMHCMQGSHHAASFAIGMNVDE